MILSTSTVVYEHAIAATVEQPGLLDVLVGMAPLILFIFVIFYFVYQRPMNKERSAHDRMVKGLLIGDRVLTIGGIHGEIVEVKDDVIVIKTGTNSTCTLSKSAIRKKIGAENA